MVEEIYSVIWHQVGQKSYTLVGEHFYPGPRQTSSQIESSHHFMSGQARKYNVHIQSKLLQRTLVTGTGVGLRRLLCPGQEPPQVYVYNLYDGIWWSHSERLKTEKDVDGC